MSRIYDKLEVSLNSYDNEHSITLEKIDTEIGKVFTYEFKVDEKTVNEISKKFCLKIYTSPF